MTDHQAILVQEMSQTGQARRRAAELAERLGMDSEESGRVGLVVTEAATNLVKHAQGGEIVLGAVRDERRQAVEIVAMDHGPGIRDVDRAMRDGYSSYGSMGSGLGAIRRNAGVFDLYTGESGTILFARVGPEPAKDAEAGPMEIGAVCVPCPGETVPGDGWAVAHVDGRTQVLIVDGLGHGAGAHEAASLAARVFSNRAGEAPLAMIEILHDALRPTRGAAGAVVELNPNERTARIAGVGNISGAILAGDRSRSMVSHHGVLGHTMHRGNEFVYPWPPGSLVILHTDGVTTHWDLDRYPGLIRRHPTVIAAAIYRDFHRRKDDATVVAVREAA